ncbi:Fe-S cluster assembly ATPase SufC [Candidatus Gracilibacteria bacterium]|nr:Fe-S cluster assembly ATPase SufC [Candidatus Gracilibacteria bacterium]MCF7819665.1 Fe-S cluster assembly ATPase SufC [Candidatus Gracilibacteria bacterium]
MLNIKNLHARLEQKEILRGINLQVNPEEIHAILGPNGSGKSTLGRVLVGDEKYEKTEGKMTLEGRNFDEMDSAERAQAGFFLSFQSPPEIDGVSAKELLLAAKKALDKDFRSSFRLKKELSENLKKLHLSDEFMTRDVHKGASGGERRKMEMASLLTIDPKIAFLDEIDSGIDVDAMKAIATAIQEFMKRKGKALILVSHTEKLLQMIQPTHFHVLCAGTIVQSGGQEIMERVHQCGFCDFIQEKKKNSQLKVVS